MPPIVGMTEQSGRGAACKVSALPREGLQRKARSEARARTCSGKPDPQGHAQMKKSGRPKVERRAKKERRKTGISGSPSSPVSAPC